MTPAEALPDGVRVVDCDVHAAAPSIETLFPYLDDHWREIATTTQFRGPTDTPHPPSAATSLHPDLVGLDPPAGAAVDDVARRVLDPWTTEIALLVCSYASEAVKNPDAAVALSRAVNGWLQEEWLDRDPRLIELILGESVEVVRKDTGRGILITETRHGFICANAGIDSSNMPGDGAVALLPEDPDGSARRLRAGIADACGVRPAVVISDSFGRAWRLGQAEVAIGCAGIEPLDDWRGRTDSQGRELAATLIATADQIAAVADLGRDKTSRTPAVLIRGLAHLVTEADGPGCRAQLRPAGEDLFR